MKTNIEIIECYKDSSGNVRFDFTKNATKKVIKIALTDINNTSTILLRNKKVVNIFINGVIAK